MGGVQKLAETRAGTFVLRGGSLILTDLGSKVVTLCIVYIFLKDILGRRSIKKRVPKREMVKTFFFHFFFFKTTGQNAK